jgi:hypothetical protein
VERIEAEKIAKACRNLSRCGSKRFLYRGPYLAHWQFLHLIMILARTAQTFVAAPKSKFFQILKICDTVKKANNGREKW